MLKMSKVYSVVYTPTTTLLHSRIEEELQVDEILLLLQLN